MNSLIFTILGFLIGIALIAGGGYYFIKEKGDKDSVKIYGTFIAIGAIITIGMIIKTIVTSGILAS
ncbi:MAG TPA: hypothetical protein VN381_00975 [Anaerovoracaceae bacterium]|nr:hypothetical protein [Anaerovoracaceae bacterium]